MKSQSIKTISAEELDRIFDEGKEDVLQYFDTSKAYVMGNEPKRVNVDFPVWMVSGLDSAAAHLGISRQALIKTWIAQMLKQAR